MQSKGFFEVLLNGLSLLVLSKVSQVHTCLLLYQRTPLIEVGESYAASIPQTISSDVMDKVAAAEGLETWNSKPQNSDGEKPHILN